MKYKLPLGWNIVTLEDVSINNSGNYGINASAVDYSDKLHRYLRITDITDDGKIDESKRASVELQDGDREKFLLKEYDIVFARTGASTGRNYFYSNNENDMIFAGFLIRFGIDPKKVNPKYIKYYCQSDEYYNWIDSIKTGSTRPNINANMYKKMPIILPPKEQQDLLVSILSSLDDKIELNNKINENLESQAQAIFKSWFVDFEPFQDGEFVDSELGMIPEGWEVVSLDKIIKLHDAKRIPLSKRKREPMEKLYPYYGATSLMDYVDDYIFDGIYLLLGEDGTVMDEKGYPVLQYVWGKFWVNNHAHVLTGKENYSIEYLYLLLNSTRVSHIITGAVQKKINQRNLKGLKVINPSVKEINKLDPIIQHIFKLKRNLLEQNKELSELRDTLLPKLMSGEIRVPLED